MTQYEAVEFEVIRFEDADVIKTSEGGDTETPIIPFNSASN